MGSDAEAAGDDTRGENVIEEVGPNYQAPGVRDGEGSGPESGGSVADSDAESVASEGTTDSSTTGKKKKKKKKSKSSSDRAGGDGQPGSTGAHLAKENHGQVTQALKDIRSNSSDCIWVDLQASCISAKSMHKLCGALQTNTETLSLNLAGNQLTGESIEDLVKALAAGAAPNLIDLDLRGNLLDNKAESGLRHLLRDRKLLNIQTGSLPSANLATAPDEGDRSADGSTASAQGCEAAEDATLANSLRGNSYVRQFFQMGGDDDDDDDAAGGAAGEASACDPIALANEMWSRVAVALDRDNPRKMAMAEPLLALSEGVQQEMDDCALPMIFDTELADLKPFTAASVSHLDLLPKLLAVQGDTQLTPFSRDEPVPALGLHRVAACELLAQLLRSQAPAIGRALPEDLLPAVVGLAMRYPGCSPAQGAALRCVSASLSDALGPLGLWRPLVDASTLPAQLADVCTASSGALPGKRSPNAGYAIALASMLRAAATTDEDVETAAWRRELGEILDRNDAWVGLCQSGGALPSLLEAQEGDLGGPKPERPGLLGDDDEGGAVLSGQDLINMLRGYNILQ